MFKIAALLLVLLGLTFPQWVVLKDILHHQDRDSSELTMAAIARRLNSNRPNIMGIIDRLKNLGLVTHGVNPGNRRAHIVSVTGKARAAAAELQGLSRETSSKALQGFSAEEASAARVYLNRIIANLTAIDIED